MTLGPNPGQAKGILLRGHHLLCLLGFQGRGYSEGFIKNMASIVASLNSNPESLTVKVVEGPDTLCAPCPFLGDMGCQAEGPGSEDKVKRRDIRVMTRLKLCCGDSLPWSELLQRIRLSIDVSDLPLICGDCQWLSQGHCQQGLRRLRQGLSEEEREQDV